MYQNGYFNISKKWKKGSYKSIKSFQKKSKRNMKEKKKHVEIKKLGKSAFSPVNMIFYSKHLEFFIFYFLKKEV